MAAEKIAVLVDSCSDVPPELRLRHHMYLVPQLLIYPEGEFRDGVDITPGEVYSRMPAEIPSTSLPGLTAVTDTIHQMRHDGYTRVVAVAISSGLSGTCNLFSLVPPPMGMRIEVVDTLNIGIGSGFIALLAARLIEEGRGFDEVVRICREHVRDSKLFICFNTLDYLRRGGRIGRVAGMLGSMLDIKPIVSCDERGVYYTAAKARGRKKQLRTALKMAEEFAAGTPRYNLTVMHADAAEEAAEVLSRLTEKLPAPELVVTGEISPALVVHTGPGLIGIGVQRLP
ncbi:MAG: DegV family protein [Coriobacteriales bacterium]|nr:DegV family protein [Coriobacteriales bacterium]